MTVTVITENEQGSPVELVDPETVTPAPPTDSEAAIAIAAIQADAAVIINEQNNEAALAIAEVHAETDETRIESNTECLSLEAQLAQALATIQQLQSEKVLASQSEVSLAETQMEIAEEIVEEIAENLTPLYTSEETVETPTEVIEKSEEEKPGLEILALPGRKPLRLLV